VIRAKQMALVVETRPCQFLNRMLTEWWAVALQLPLCLEISRLRLRHIGSLCEKTEYAECYCALKASGTRKLPSSRGNSLVGCNGRASVDRRKFGERNRGGQVIYVIIGRNDRFFLSDNINHVCNFFVLLVDQVLLDQAITGAQEFLKLRSFIWFHGSHTIIPINRTTLDESLAGALLEMVVTDQAIGGTFATSYAPMMVRRSCNRVASRGASVINSTPNCSLAAHRTRATPTSMGGWFVPAKISKWR
jgi:hypothetical protein